MKLEIGKSEGAQGRQEGETLRPACLHAGAARASIISKRTEERTRAEARASTEAARALASVGILRFNAAGEAFYSLGRYAARCAALAGEAARARKNAKQYRAARADAADAADAAQAGKDAAQAARVYAAARYYYGAAAGAARAYMSARAEVRKQEAKRADAGARALRFAKRGADSAKRVYGYGAAGRKPAAPNTEIRKVDI